MTREQSITSRNYSRVTLAFFIERLYDDSMH